jgi:hypothetical protein
MCDFSRLNYRQVKILFSVKKHAATPLLKHKRVKIEARVCTDHLEVAINEVMTCIWNKTDANSKSGVREWNKFIGLEFVDGFIKSKARESKEDSQRAEQFLRIHWPKLEDAIKTVDQAEREQQQPRVNEFAKLRKQALVHARWLKASIKDHIRTACADVGIDLIEDSVPGLYGFLRNNPDFYNSLPRTDAIVIRNVDAQNENA